MLSNMTPLPQVPQLRKAWQAAALPSLVMESLSLSLLLLISLYGIDRGVASRIALASLICFI